MKILIDNRTNLSNTEIGILLDMIDLSNEKWYYYEYVYNKSYHVEALKMKRYLKVFIMEISTESEEN